MAGKTINVKRDQPLVVHRTQVRSFGRTGGRISIPAISVASPTQTCVAAMPSEWLTLCASCATTRSSGGRSVPTHRRSVPVSHHRLDTLARRLKPIADAHRQTWPLPMRGVVRAVAKAPRTIHNLIVDGPASAPHLLRAPNRALLMTGRVTLLSLRRAREAPLSAPQEG